MVSIILPKSFVTYPTKLFSLYKIQRGFCLYRGRRIFTHVINAQTYYTPETHFAEFKPVVPWGRCERR
jgi:hypothetical protein